MTKELLFAFCITLFSFNVWSQQKKEKEEMIACIQTLFKGMKSGDSSLVKQTFHDKIRLMTCTFIPIRNWFAKNL